MTGITLVADIIQGTKIVGVNMKEKETTITPCVHTDKGSNENHPTSSEGLDDLAYQSLNLDSSFDVLNIGCLSSSFLQPNLYRMTMLGGCHSPMSSCYLS